jgi:ADP-ribose pyrophosphatase YjhB (NUDIX family)
MEKQFTASVYILEGDKVLLLFHPKLQKWLPPGGHLEEGELPTECAIREALEETGLQVELIKDERAWVSRWNASSFERPWLCLLENIPEHNAQAAHQHMDFVYLGKAIGGQIEEQHHKQHQIRWFTRDAVMSLRGDEEIFLETQEILEKVFSLTLAENHSLK